MPSPSSHTELVDVLRAHGVSLDAAAVAAAWDDPATGPRLISWVKAHLGADTLLSQDEQKQFAALESSGRAAKLVASGDTGATKPPLRDAELEAAVAILQRSTAEVRGQTETLQRQRAAVARLAALDYPHGRPAWEARHRAVHWDPARRALADAVAALERTVSVRADGLAEQARELVGQAQQTAAALGQADDAVMTSLQKLGRALALRPDEAGDTDVGEDDTDREQEMTLLRLRDVCLRQIQTTVEAVRTTLDRRFLEALNDYGDDDDDTDAATKDVASLEAELESLYAEILPVAQMVGEHQHLTPALRVIATARGRRRARALQAMDYMLDSLDVLSERLRLRTVRISTVHAHQTVTNAMLATSRAIVTEPVEPVEPTGPAPGKIRLQSIPQASPAGTRAGGRPRHTTDVPAIDEALQRLSLRLPVDMDVDDDDHVSVARTVAAIMAKTAFLEATLDARTATAAAVAADAHKSLEATVTAQLADARNAVWAAHSAVQVDDGPSAVPSNHLVDPEIDASIDIMAQEVARVRTAVEETKRAAIAAQRHGSERLAQLVQRWG